MPVVGVDSTGALDQRIHQALVDFGNPPVRVDVSEDGTVLLIGTITRRTTAERLHDVIARIHGVRELHVLVRWEVDDQALEQLDQTASPAQDMPSKALKGPAAK